MDLLLQCPIQKNGVTQRKAATLLHQMISELFHYKKISSKLIGTSFQVYCI